MGKCLIHAFASSILEMEPTTWLKNDLLLFSSTTLLLIEWILGTTEYEHEETGFERPGLCLLSVVEILSTEKFPCRRENKIRGLGRQDPAGSL